MKANKNYFAVIVIALMLVYICYISYIYEINRKQKDLHLFVYGFDSLPENFSTYVFSTSCYSSDQIIRHYKNGG